MISTDGITIATTTTCQIASIAICQALGSVSLKVLRLCQQWRKAALWRTATGSANLLFMATAVTSLLPEETDVKIMLRAPGTLQ